MLSMKSILYRLLYILSGAVIGSAAMLRDPFADLIFATAVAAICVVLALNLERS